MGKLTAQECKAVAAPFLKDGIKKVYVTNDGNVFHENNKHHASNHSRSQKHELHEVEADAETDALNIKAASEAASEEAKPKRGRPANTQDAETDAKTE